MSITVTDLPHKEQGLFRSALKLYESQQFKKGLKTSEQILKKFPNHGETLAMKGMFLAQMDRKDEGYEFIKRGLEISPTSSISWHIYGLVCQRDKKYSEAIRCYEESLSADMENLHILRELASLYIQSRQFAKAVEIRQRLVKINPKFPPFWIGLAVAHHLNGHPELALKVFDAHEHAVLGDPTTERAQVSKLLLYKNWLIELTGDYQKAIENLKEIRPRITDIGRWMEQKATLLLKTGRKEAAAMAFQDLIERNPENNDYIAGYIACNSLDIARPEDEESVLEVVEGLQQQFPSSNRLRFLPLTFCTGDRFARAAEVLAKHALRKGIPSLFSSVRVLYADEAKGAALGRLIEGFAGQLRDTNRLGDSAEDEPQSVLMWCNAFLAQHHDYYGDHERALALIDAAIQASPDVVELYIFKAKILKHAGDLRAARDTMDFGRQKDLLDRYINTKAVKYMLRNNELVEAEKLFLEFVNQEAPHRLQEIVTIQATWYMCERGRALRRLGDIGRALKQLHFAIGAFEQYDQDQFDFHMYSVRKMTLRTYVDILEWENTIYAHPIFGDAARAAIECYVELHDRRQAGDPVRAVPDEKDGKPLTRNGAAQHGQHHVIAPSGGSGENRVFSVDVDPSGTEYLNADDHLAPALALVEKLEAASGAQPATHLLAFEVHLRMAKYFLALKAINALRAIDAGHLALVPMAARLGHALDTDAAFVAPMKAALKGQLAKSFGDATVASSVAAHPESFAHALAGAKALAAMGDAAAARAMLLQAPARAGGRSLDGLLEAKQALEAAGASASELGEFAAAAKKALPLATCF
ncbi:hypothetical protein H4R18_004754 [Coemansia javaensis]|uniref:Tetratricopeptide repeat protein 21A/21B C-terminal ARM domain-containing protein n=1 Tax=Coemansia javaensis TaxID=2761396 RepID=A0A9W8H5A0_9FUNG|nr:hypothetical protein H4R18_004754 [Coemansia javaensis]